MVVVPFIFMNELVVSESRDEVSTGMLLDGTGTATVGLVVKALFGSSPTVTTSVEESNDLDNWQIVSSVSPLALHAVGAVLVTIGPFQVPGTNQIDLRLGARFVRLRVNLSVASGPGTALVETGIIRGQRLPV